MGDEPIGPSERMQRPLMEEPFFFRNVDYRLFGVLHRPVEETSSHPDGPLGSGASVGIVFCSPFAEEKLWSHRVFVRFARLLAKRGLVVLRFDYMGNGDSEGDFEHSTLETNLADIRSAVDEIRRRSGVSRVGLLGLQLGATWATLAAQRSTGVDLLVLWEPVVRVEDYLQKCLRSNLTTQLAVHKKVVKNRKEITSELLQGVSANIDGYLMSGELYKQACAIHLLNADWQLPVPVLLVHISSRENGTAGKDLELLYESRFKQASPESRYLQVIEESFWSEIKTYHQEAPRLFEETIRWLQRIHCSSEASAASSPKAVCSDTV